MVCQPGNVWGTTAAPQPSGVLTHHALDAQVLYTRGSPQLWKATFEAGKVVNSSNAASQDLNPDGRCVACCEGGCVTAELHRCALDC